MSDISDEAVQKALAVIIEADPWGKVDDEAMRAALEAAQPIMMRVEQEWDRAYIQQLLARIRELEDAVLEVISAQENGPLRQATLHDPNMEQMRRRLRALLPEGNTDE